MVNPVEVAVVFGCQFADCLQYARNPSICNRMVLEATIPPYNKDMADWHEYLSRDPQICGGELCAKGTRIPVTVILDSLGEGSTMEAILASYPSLKPEHIQASLAYAAELAHEERLLPLKVS